MALTGISALWKGFRLQLRQVLPDSARSAARGSFAKLCSSRYAKDNLRMNNVLPGSIDTLPEKEERRVNTPMVR